jgi:hypothetical protein
VSDNCTALQGLFADDGRFLIFAWRRAACLLMVTAAVLRNVAVDGQDWHAATGSER